MRESIRRALSVVMVFAVVGAGTVAMVNLNQGPEPVDQYGAVQDGEAIAPAVAGVVAVGIGLYQAGQAAEQYFSGSSEVDPAEYEEAQQVQSELYSQALGQAETGAVINSSQSNYLEDTSTIARLEGKNQLIKSLENDSSQAEAVTEAREKVLDYYAKQQVTVLQSFGARARSIERISSSAESEQNLTATNVVQIASVYDDGTINYWDEPLSFSNTTVELVNGSTRTAKQVSFSVGSDTWTLSPSSYAEYGSSQVKNISVMPPDSQSNSGASPVGMLQPVKYPQKWQEIDSHGLSVADNVENFSEQAYNEWSAGLISSEDLVDPYLGAREYDPTETGESWSMRSLTSIGVTPPANVSNLERMQVRDESTGAVYNGTLMAQADPPNADGYSVGETYDTANISGHVFLATNEGPRKLQGKFTLVGADRIDGSSYSDGETIHYDRPDYQTADLSEYKQLSEELQKLRADLEAREQRIESNASGGGGGLFDFGDLGASLPFGGAGIVVALGAIVVLGLVTRN